LIAGIAAAVLVMVVVAIIVLFLLMKKWRKGTAESDETEEGEAETVFMTDAFDQNQTFVSQMGLSDEAKPVSGQGDPGGIFDSEDYADEK
jgi:flagellar biosynthesis/type III secretory pathway M-ring protein FliF/YscJ